jgi:hypothetical protein
MDEHGHGDEFPLLQFVQGGPSQDGRTLLVEAVTAQGPVHLSIALQDLKHLVSFLLLSAGRMTVLSAAANGEPPSVSECSPIPITSISVGEPNGDQGFLGIDVGAAELVFSLPLEAFAPIARTMLTASARLAGGMVT